MSAAIRTAVIANRAKSEDGHRHASDGGWRSGGVAFGILGLHQIERLVSSKPQVEPGGDGARSDRDRASGG